VRDLVRQHFRFFLFATFAAIAFRLIFLFRFPAITSDSLVYGDIAKNWLQRGIYGLTGIGDITPTYIRLPGYPAFLAAVFAVFGMEHYRAALILQILVDIGTCFLIADIGRRLISPRAAKAAFVLSALCPFLANYAAAALTETGEVFCTVLALDLALTGLSDLHVPRYGPWLGCGLAIAGAILLRPDGGLLLMAVGVYLAGRIAGIVIKGQAAESLPHARYLAKAGLAVLIAALVPLIPWTLRNWQTFHEFQPLSPRYADDPGTYIPMGFNRWVKTWLIDYASVEEIYWAAPGNSLDVDKLPDRAFDTPEQRDQTEQLLDDYNQNLKVTPALDARFQSLAADRVRHSRLRYYVWLPLLRVADMWLRPRTEILPCNTRWWEFDEEPRWLVLSIAIGVANLFYIAAALAGLVRGKFSAHLGLLLTFLVLRSAFLGTLENPETRYTLECFPIVIVLASSLAGTTRNKIDSVT
jgi:4-amino-4-deoxy-L-arabinose transferase-like glycosyltransferase